MELVTFSSEEREVIFSLAEQLTGTCQGGKYRRDVLLQNVLRRMTETGLDSLGDYLSLAEENPEEFEHLISALTIHTTSWFREPPHFAKLREHLENDSENLARRTFRMLCGACSTGAEPYSFALVLESIRQAHPGFEYEVVGTDIDPVSVSKARRAIYPADEAKQIPNEYRRYLLAGTGQTQGFFTLSKDIRSRCRFATNNLLTLQTNSGTAYDEIVVRNVLIYFEPADVSKIIKNLLEMLTPQGILCLGHSEAIDPKAFGLRALGNSCYSRLAQDQNKKERSDSLRRRVLVVDDSEVVRKVLSKMFDSARFNVAAVGSADEATEFLKSNSVDLITLDLHMPGMDGQTWLRSQRRNGLRVPVVVVSDAAPSEAMEVLGAMENGAQDYIEKAKIHQNKQNIVGQLQTLIESYKGTGNSSDRGRAKRLRKISDKRPDLILLGASTGGTEVLANMLKLMPNRCPPVAIVQHITSNFAEPFARRLAEVSGLKLGDIRAGAKLEPGHLYMALGDYHIGVKKQSPNLVLTISDSPPIHSCRPAVDFLFSSASLLSGVQIAAALMTGMGADGARGLAELKNRQADTFAQNEETCAVFGMPKEAIRLDAANFIGSPEEIRREFDELLKR